MNSGPEDSGQPLPVCCWVSVCVCVVVISSRADALTDDSGFMSWTDSKQGTKMAKYKEDETKEHLFRIKWDTVGFLFSTATTSGLFTVTSNICHLVCPASTLSLELFLMHRQRVQHRKLTQQTAFKRFAQLPWHCVIGTINPTNPLCFRSALSSSYISSPAAA